MKFVVTTEGRDSLGLRALVQGFAESQWIPTHYTPEQAVEFVLDQFRRTVAAELEMIEVKCEALTSQ
jgi:hypothetical protein